MRFSFKAILLLLFILTSSKLFCQDPSTHKKQFFIGQDSMLYIPKGLGFYLHLSTSPDGQKLSLNQQFPSDNNGMRPELSGPVFFEIKKPNGNRIPNLKYAVTIDSVAPKSNLQLINAPTTTQNNTLFYGKGLIAQLNSSDKLSGLKGIYYAINDKTYVTYNSSINLETEGNYQIKYYGADQVGNIEQIQTKDFIIDLTPPTSIVETIGISTEKTFPITTKLKLNSNDSLSGAKKIEWFLNQEKATNYSRPISLFKLKDGKHILSYKATDHVQNEEPLQTYEFWIDRVPPYVQYKLIGDFFFHDKLYFSANTQIELQAIDNRSGIKNIFYNLDNQGENQYAAPLQLQDTTGTHSIHYYAEDQVGNSSKKSYTKLKFTYDTTPPNLEVAYEGPQHLKNDTLFIKEYTRIKANITDKLAGVKTCTYQLDSADFILFKGAIRVQQEGIHQVTFQCSDWVNNSSTHHIEVFVDRTAPEISFELNEESLSSKKINSEDYQVVSKDCQVTMSAQDSHSGVLEMYYVINGGLKKDYSTAIGNFKAGDPIILELYAVDQLGNTQREVVRLFIEK